MALDEFTSLVAEVVANLPASLTSRMEGRVVIDVEEVCPQEDFAKGMDYYKAHGFRPGSGPQAVLGICHRYGVRRRIVLFRLPHDAGDLDAIRRRVRRTLWHEIGHALGMDEAETRSVEGYSELRA
jgi:predicted Zn-dependent protease with MMP-like domain